MRIGKDMLRQLSVQLGSECITRAALVEEFTTLTRDKDKDDPSVNSSLTVFAEEFAVFIGDKNPDMVSTLTDLFDCPETWSYVTKNKGRYDIIRPYLNLIGAITPSLLQNRLSSDAIGGGLVSRFVFVVESGAGKRIAMPFLTEDEIFLGRQLLSDLQQILEMNGPFGLTEDAINAYTDWYENPESHVNVDSGKFVGYHARRQVHLLKLAMVMSAARSNRMMIEAEDLVRALSVLEGTEMKMHNAFTGSGAQNRAELVQSIIRYIYTKKAVTLADLTQYFMSDIDLRSLQEIINSLIQAGRVRRCKVDQMEVLQWVPKEGG